MPFCRRYGKFVRRELWLVSLKGATMSARARQPGDQTFRKNDVLRLIDCARRQKLTKYRIDVRHGGLTLIVGESKSAVAEPPNDLDQWVAKKKK